MTDGKIFFGVDGGGTKTAFALEVGGQKYTCKKSTIHPRQVGGAENFKKIFEEALDELTEKAGISPKDIDSSFIAVPGYGQYPETEEKIDQILTELLESKNFYVGNDCVNGRAGSLNGKEGVNLVLGTGQIAFGVDKNGKSMRSGGRGPFLGDEGSGYYIGKKILNLFTKMSDGRIEKSFLYDAVREKLSLKDDMEIIDLAEKMSRTEVASLSRLLSEGLERGDSYCLEILEDLGYQSALTIDSIINALDFSSPTKVSYSGGIFNLGEDLLDAIRKNLKNDVEIVAPFADPLEGSLILARLALEGKKFS